MLLPVRVRMGAVSLTQRTIYDMVVHLHGCTEDELKTALPELVQKRTFAYNLAKIEEVGIVKRCSGKIYAHWHREALAVGQNQLSPEADGRHEI